jgi:3-deoxy-D-manno-octulosonate 8-phosphate phosphatase KdsC-like HAD superfamily phosphatase
MHNTADRISKEPIQDLKILFLDIDGVLNSEIYYKNLSLSENGLSRFDPNSVEPIKNWFKNFRCK